MHLPDQLIGRSNGEVLTTVLPVSFVGLPSRKKGCAVVNLRVATRCLITEVALSSAGRFSLRQNWE